MSAYFKNYNIVQNTAHYFVFSKNLQKLLFGSKVQIQVSLASLS